MNFRLKEIIQDCFSLKSGDVVEYNHKLYYFRPNGAVCYLYDTLYDYRKKKGQYRAKCMSRRKLNGCNLYEICEEDVDMRTDESSESSTDEEAAAEEWRNRAVIMTLEDMYQTPPA